MNFLALVNRVKTESARSGGPIVSIAEAFGDDARIVGWVASAWVDLQNETDWRWMRKSVEKDIVGGGWRYPPATLLINDFRRWVDPSRDYSPVVYQVATPGDITELHQYNADLFRREFLVRAVAPGSPQVWAIDYNDDLLVGPTPASDWKIKIDYWSDVTRLVADGNVPELPGRYHEVLVWRALMELASFDAAPEVYSRAKSNYDRMHGDLRHEQGPKMGMIGRVIA